ncbi:hypothetical protein BJ170DRAFT_267881 [Xylariales sp. AK1849]|nr:hypothetical protein BJ170DRAFT_267881 [Xylariales sp. AK1849]
MMCISRMNAYLHVGLLWSLHTHIVRNTWFSGHYLDWDTRLPPERGSRSGDMEYVALVQELREAFGTGHGISLILAPVTGTCSIQTR